MLPADAAAAADLRRGAEALKTFKKRVDALLSTFEGSPGSAQKVSAQTVSRASFSGNGSFSEADDLHLQYHRVHEKLTSLSKSLSHQIEAIGIAVHGADVGFDNLDEDLRHRFWVLQAQIREDNKPPEQGGPSKHSNAQQSGTGYS